MSMLPPIPNPQSPFPATRLRRPRTHAWSRELLAETRLHASDLIQPFFVQEGRNLATPIPSLPGISRLSIDLLVQKAKEAKNAGLCAIALFPVIDAGKKDEYATEAFHADNLIARAIAAVKDAVPELGVIADVALDPYTVHGHDGFVVDGAVDNDSTVEALARQALHLVRAGCDIVAPSDMMDGRVAAIRRTLESEGFHQTMILSYAAKYASSLYGPFRDAVDSKRFLGNADKRGYQMHIANTDEAMREITQDIAEGADLIMIKPALTSLDIIQRARTSFNIPLLAYQVSGEYAMLHASAEKHMLDADTAQMEMLTAIRRAGARAIFTYAALDVAQRILAG